MGGQAKQKNLYSVVAIRQRPLKYILSYLHVLTLGPTSTLIDTDGVVVPAVPNPTVPVLLCILSIFYQVIRVFFI